MWTENSNVALGLIRSFHHNRVHGPVSRVIGPSTIRKFLGAHYVLKSHRNRESSSSTFKNWASHAISTGRLPQSSIVEGGLHRVGMCTILESALDPAGFSGIRQGKLPPVDPATRIDSGDLAEWNRHRERLRSQGASGRIACVHQFVSEIDDDDALLAYSVMDYVDARAFHSMQEKDTQRAAAYRQRALSVLSQGPTTPNILSTAVVAIVGSEECPELIVANRKGRGEPGFHPDCWAVSIGEIFMPESGKRGNRFLDADESVAASAVRGLREELLTNVF